MSIVRWWSIVEPLRRRSGSYRQLTSVRVHVWIRNVSRTPSALWNTIVSVPRPSESVRTLDALPCPLRVGILVRIDGTVWVSQILVISRRVLADVRVSLL
jgi:hypothetical protein